MSRALSALIGAVACTLAGEPDGRPDTCSFDSDAAGKLPQGWKAAATHPGGALATWAVRAEAAAPSAPNTLAITKIPAEPSEFNLCYREEPGPADADLSVRMRADSGKEDQGGGLVWRLIDADNYYVCRFNPLEDNFRLYKVVQGNRTQLAGVTVKSAPAGHWYTVRAVMAGPRITCWLDGKELLHAQDGTFERAGRVGLWTKADAATSFDDLTVAPAKR